MEQKRVRERAVLILPELCSFPFMPQSDSSANTAFNEDVRFRRMGVLLQFNLNYFLDTHTRHTVGEC